ncbi:hypothetical protein A9G11_03115 [Gilliamella sp. wkB108]|uniref:phage tail protein n=1 Tax=Gilliamella sp. wkB108 TaxID=3120256 RepID=UPI00080DC017|nr:phage tail protein [Gilliamella apicola]OCG24658.1 hypothetical protein A9G11_03115 [Gilliamella apicola]
MSQKFYTLITTQGAALLANATALGIPLKLTKMAVGDANGSESHPTATQTKLIHEIYRAPINTITTDKDNPNQIIAELVIPETQGGWFINEIGLYDDGDNLIAVGNCPVTYKPKLVEGSGRTQVIRMIIIVDNVDSVQLKIDPATVLATRNYVDELIATKMTNHEKSTNHPDATTQSKGFVQLNSATNSTAENQAATPLAVKDTFDYAKYVDEKAQSSYNHATDAHNRITDVHNIVNHIVDTFQSQEFESDVFSPDKRFCIIIRNDGVVGMYNRVNNRLAWGFTHDGVLGEGYVPVERILNLDLFIRDRCIPVGVPMPWPQTIPPGGYFECNGAPIDRNRFSKLAAAYPSGYLPDLRGEFVRGWDNGKGIDPSRGILSWQGDAIRNIWGQVETFVTGSTNDANASGAFYSKVNSRPAYQPGSSGGGTHQKLTLDASTQVPTAPENRPRNIAFMYIVKAE